MLSIRCAVLTGFYCEDWGLFEPTGPCQAGYYCIAGTLHVHYDASTVVEFDNYTMWAADLLLNWIRQLNLT